MAEEQVMTKAELLQHMQQGWNDFNAYLKTLTPEQLTRPTDAAGWTAKDHIMHIVVWEDGIDALLSGTSRRERMGLDQATWDSRDFDQMNAVIQQCHKDKSLAEVMQTFQTVHQRLIAKIETLTDADLQRPYKHYQSDSTADKPVIGWVKGNTYEHYAEHRPWIAAIVAG